MEASLNKSPIYQQLNAILRQLLASDEYQVGDKFLTEREICKRFDVSRATANKALSNLVSEGLLEFRKGVGTFVRVKPTDDGLHSLASFTGNTLAAGKKPSSKVLQFETVKAGSVSKEIAESLQVDADEDLYLIKRLRLADNRPMILEHRYVVSKYCPGLKRESLTGSLYACFVNEFHLDITGADETIRAVSINKEEAQLLEVEEGGAGFLVVAIGYINGDTPLWYERTLHRPDGFALRCYVRPRSTNRKLQERLFLSKQQS